MNVIKPTEKKEGAGAKVKRLFPSQEMKHLDPFVLLDEFFVDPSKGFPPHEHRGFEAITYMLDGGFRHKDDLGNDSTVYRGCVQKFTAGRGITHSEMPVGEDQPRVPVMGELTPCSEGRGTGLHGIEIQRYTGA